MGTLIKLVVVVIIMNLSVFLTKQCMYMRFCCCNIYSLPVIIYPGDNIRCQSTMYTSSKVK